MLARTLSHTRTRTHTHTHVHTHTVYEGDTLLIDARPAQSKSCQGPFKRMSQLGIQMCEWLSCFWF